MGCITSKPATADDPFAGSKSRRKKFCKPKPWRNETPLTRSQVERMREEFWDTAPHYGGQRVIWDALKAAATEEDLELAHAIIDSAGILVDGDDLSVSYDERGVKYELPNYVQSDPANLIEG